MWGQSNISTSTCPISPFYRHATSHTRHSFFLLYSFFIPPINTVLNECDKEQKKGEPGKEATLLVCFLLGGEGYLNEYVLPCMDTICYHGYSSSIHGT